MLQVDSCERLAELCGIIAESGKPAECFCAIVTSDPSILPNTDPPLSPSEQTLTDFYECTLTEFPRPVVRLTQVTWTSGKMTMLCWFHGSKNPPKQMYKSVYTYSMETGDCCTKGLYRVQVSHEEICRKKIYRDVNTYKIYRQGLNPMICYCY